MPETIESIALRKENKIESMQLAGRKRTIV